MAEMYAQEDVSDPIRAAVLAERERCAVLAEALAESYRAKSGTNLHAIGLADGADFAAAAIRKEPTT